MRRLSIQIQPRISEEMKQRIDQECKTRRVTQGEIVDAALEAFFYPQQEEETKYELILRQYAALRELIVERSLALEARLQANPMAQQDEALPLPHQETEVAHVVPTQSDNLFEQWSAIRDHHATHTHPLGDETEAEAAPVLKPRGMLTRLFVK